MSADLGLWVARTLGLSRARSGVYLLVSYVKLVSVKYNFVVMSHTWDTKRPHYRDFPWKILAGGQVAQGKGCTGRSGSS